MGACEVNLAKWNMVKECYECRVENLNLKEQDRLDLPVDKVNYELFPDKDKKGNKAESDGFSNIFAHERRLTEGTFITKRAEKLQSLCTPHKHTQ